MTQVTGQGLKLRLALAQLAAQHGVAARPVCVPLAAPCTRAMCLSGLASTSDVDLHRCRFKPYCFNNPCLLIKHEFPKLLYKHDVPAGYIQALSYDAVGRLKITAEVTHPLARRCNAFSVACTIEAYELRDTATKHFHALVTKAYIDEVSLTDTPANPHALVTARTPAFNDQFYALANNSISKMTAIVALLREVNARPLPAPPPPPAFRSTPFAQLVAQINQEQNL